MSFTYSQPNHDTDLSFVDKISMTEQAHKEEVDIHFIMKRYHKTGMINHTSTYEGSYGDFVSSPEYHEAQNIIASANSMFETIPSSIRSEFANDPAQFLDFIQDPTNKQQMEDYGFSTSHFPPTDECDKPEPKAAKQPKSPDKGKQNPQEE